MKRDCTTIGASKGRLNFESAIRGSVGLSRGVLDQLASIYSEDYRL